MPVYLHIYDVNFKVDSDCPELLIRIKRDFLAYVEESEKGGAIHVESCLGPGERTRSHIVLAGDVAVAMNHTTKNATIYCPTIDRLHEITYLYVLSVLGKKLDQRGMHRIHASAVACAEGEAALFVGASGVGKSHLAYLLPYPTLSDDTPFVSAGGLHPMTIRRGFLPDHALAAGAMTSCYELQRLKHGRKILLPLAEKSARDVFAIKAIYFLRLGEQVACRRATWWQTGLYLARYLLIGEGTPQILPFFWEPGGRDLLVKVGIFLARFKLLGRLLTHRQCFLLTVDRSPQVIDFVKNHLKSVP